MLKGIQKPFTLSVPILIFILYIFFLVNKDFQATVCPSQDSVKLQKNTQHCLTSYFWLCVLNLKIA